MASEVEFEIVGGAQTAWVRRVPLKPSDVFPAEPDSDEISWDDEIEEAEEAK